VCRSVLQCDAVCCSVLQCVAVCCSVLQCVAVCCSGICWNVQVRASVHRGSTRGGVCFSIGVGMECAEVSWIL